MNRVGSKTKKKVNTEVSKQLNAKSIRFFFNCCRAELCQTVDSIQEPEIKAVEGDEVADVEPKPEDAEEEPEEKTEEAAAE